jgi:integrase
MVRAGEQKAHAMTTEIITETPFRTARRQRRITGGKLTGQKPALKMKEVWSIRARLELKKRVRDLALFNLAIDSKLRDCDLTRLKVEDIAAGGEVKTRGIIVQKKTGRPVQFEIKEQTRNAVANLIRRHYLRSGDYPFSEPARQLPSPLDAPVCAHRAGLGGVDRP